MALTTADLDGTWLVTSVSDYDGPFEKKSDGTTVIRNGETRRTDAAGCEWRSVFTVLSDDAVEMVSTVDPSQAAPDFALTRPNGEATREPVTYKTLLKAQRKGDKIRLSGSIRHGATTVLLTMTRTGG